MQQTFLYSYGKVVLEKDTLFMREMKSSVTINKLWMPWLTFYFLAKFFDYFGKEESAKRNLGLVVTGFLLVFYFLLNADTIYKFLFRRSFAKRIGLKNILGYRTEEDPNTLDVQFFLQLRSGRERKITFRKMENEHERLGGLLSQYLANPKFA